MPRAGQPSAGSVTFTDIKVSHHTRPLVVAFELGCCRERPYGTTPPLYIQPAAGSVTFTDIKVGHQETTLLFNQARGLSPGPVAKLYGTGRSYRYSRNRGAVPVSGMDSELDAFSHQPTDGSFSALAFQLTGPGGGQAADF